MNTNFCITLTTIPSRLENLHKTIDSITKQTLKPNKIFINVPIKYYRFPELTISNNELEKFESELVKINRCEDFGPATKIMGGLNDVLKFDCGIIIDDDHIYNEKMC